MRFLQQESITPHLLEWTGVTIGIVAAILLASNIAISGWAFVLYLISSIMLAIWGFYRKAYGIMLQNLIFIGINTLGIYRWLLS